MWNLVALSFDFVPDGSVVFLLKEGQLFISIFLQVEYILDLEG